MVPGISIYFPFSLHLFVIRSEHCCEQNKNPSYEYKELMQHPHTVLHSFSDKMRAALDSHFNFDHTRNFRSGGQGG